MGRPWDLVFRHGATRVDAEAAHRLGMRALGLASATIATAPMATPDLAPRDPALRTRFLGHELAVPLGVAAGLDKDAEAVLALGRLGFAAVEVGTVTAHPQPGNPRPRLFRLPADRALVNRLGFNNAGSEATAARLARLGPPGDRVPGCPLLGVNIGRTKTAEDVFADHVLSARRLGPWADYVVVNVSSPNTPGLRALQGVDALGPLLGAVREALDGVAARRVPLLVKITADLDEGGVDAVADLALDTGLDGIVATNTTLARDGLRTPPAEVAAAGDGGLSGAPLVAPARGVLARLAARVGERVALVSVGGIDSGAEADIRLRAGASLVQTYTGFVYGGPGWPRRVARELGAIRAARETPPPHG